MKFFHILTVSLTISFVSNGQIIYDFSKRTNIDIKQLKKQIKPVKNGDFVIFKIENINTFRYKVEMEGNSIDYMTPVPSELQTLFRLPKEEVSQQVKYAQDAASQTGAQGPRMTDVRNKISSSTRLSHLRALARPTAEQQVELDNLEAFEDTMTELINLCEKYTNLMVKVADIKFTRMLLINVSKQKWNKHSDLLDELPPAKNENSMKSNYLEFVRLYHEVEALYEKAAKMARNLRLTDDEKEIKEATENIEQAYHQIENDAFLSLIEDIITLQRALENENYFEVISPPIQMDGDYVEFRVNITPTRVNDLLPYEQAMEFEVEVPGKGGWRADFSVGPTLSFGSGAKNESYFFKNTVSADTTSGLPVISQDGTLEKTNESDVVRPGIAAMIHAYRRSGSQLNWGLMLGVGAGFESVNDANLSIYLGPTFVLGKQQKFMFSTGVSFHSVDRLNEKYSLGTNYDENEIDISNLTKRYFKPSLFIGLSYAIGARTIVN
ncbi:MAG: hypothetical protein ABJO02_09750 [Reichenbachiella sp.]|uniref:hypothetical protein n=1 Tax=Reichenbachiella sp. TaxID=2184521 RepID=UPI003298B584